MKNYNEEIANEVRCNRAHLGLSQSDFAKRCGLTRHKIQEIESGQAPTIEEFMALDKMLDGDLYWRLSSL